MKILLILLEYVKFTFDKRDSKKNLFNVYRSTEYLFFLWKHWNLLPALEYENDQSRPYVDSSSFNVIYIFIDSLIFIFVSRCDNLDTIFIRITLYL